MTISDRLKSPLGGNTAHFAPDTSRNRLSLCIVTLNIRFISLFFKGKKLILSLLIKRKVIGLR